MAKKAARASRPAGEQHDGQHDEQQRSDFNPFLKVDHLEGRGPHKLLMSGWVRPINSQFGKQLAVEVTIEGDPDQKYDFAFKVGSPNHRMFFLSLGNDTASWGTSSVTVEVTKSRNDRPLINVLAVDRGVVPF